jgi:hypothetical protein
MAFLKLDIVDMPADMYGIYPEPKGETMPARARFLHPAAAASYNAMNLDKKMRVSDVLRSAESSLNAVRAGRGAQHPSFSGHNYGFSIDIQVDWMLKTHQLDKRALDAWMESHGWYCFRKDHANASEWWHYNFFGPEAADLMRAAEDTNQASLERKIQRTYGGSFALTDAECQDALLRLGLYSGKVDGDIGPISRSAIRAFQRAWELDEYFRSREEYQKQQLGPVTRRTLAFVEGERVRAGAIKASTM